MARAFASFARALPVALSLVAAAAAGCSNIIGIDEAKCDPTIAGCPTSSGLQSASPLCQQYCDTVMNACTGKNEQYVDMNACVSVCSFIPEGQAGAIDNSVQCRLDLAQIAATSPEPDSYCPGAGPSGDAPQSESDCTGESMNDDPCTSLCEILMPACAHYPQYGSMDECVTTCRQQTGPHSTADEHYTSSTSY